MITSAFRRQWLEDNQLRALTDKLNKTYQGPNEQASIFVPRYLRMLRMINPEMIGNEQLTQLNLKKRFGKLDEFTNQRALKT